MGKIKIIHYFLINKKCGLVGGHDYTSHDAAEESIDSCNIPNEDAQVFVLSMSHTNHINHNKCTPLNFDKVK